MAFRKKWTKIIELKPDILVIQECENESKYKAKELIPNYNQFLWFGENSNKGLAVISFNEYKVSFKKSHNPDFKYIVPINLSYKKKKIDLYIIWAMPYPNSTSKSYIGQIWNAINYYPLQSKKDTILIGDWNSNAQWDKLRQKGNHSTSVNKLEKLDIFSLYHQLKKEEPGAETEPTLYLLKNPKKPYHIDYCFASKRLLNKNTTIEVGKFEEWISSSDHMPVVISDLG